VAKRFDWDKVRRNKKVWFKQPWEDLHHFWRGYQTPKHRNNKTRPTHVILKNRTTPKENGAILRNEFSDPIALEVPAFSKFKATEGKFRTPLISFNVLFLDYLAPDLPNKIRHRLLEFLKDLKVSKDPYIALSTFEKRLRFLAHLDSWRFDHDIKHLELHFIPRKNIYGLASMIWPDIDSKE
jgi:hypothetical protein